MTEQNNHEQPERQQQGSTFNPVGMGIGLAIGAGIAFATGNVGLIGVGVAIGAAIGIAMGQNEQQAR